MTLRVTGKPSQNLSTNQQPQVGGIFAARVSFVILNDLDNPQVFKQKGEWSFIGGLFFNSIKPLTLLVIMILIILLNLYFLIIVLFLQ